MKIAVLKSTGFTIEERPSFEPESHEVLMKTIACGICSGDVFQYRERMHQEGELLLGHEASGVVCAVGDGVRSLQAGDVVTAMSIPAYSDYFIAPTEKLVPLPDTVDPRYVVGEALACSVHAMNRVQVGSTTRVAVLGGGFMGQICLQLARDRGASQILLVDPIAERRNLRGAAARALDPQADAEALALLSRSFDLVIEAAGLPASIDLATDLVNFHGTLLVIGYHQSNGGMRTVNMKQWNYKGINVINGHVRRHDEKVAAMHQAVRLLAQERLQTQDLITFYPFDDISRAFDDLVARKPGLMKAVLIMDAQYA